MTVHANHGYQSQHTDSVLGLGLGLGLELGLGLGLVLESE